MVTGQHPFAKVRANNGDVRPGTTGQRVTTTEAESWIDGIVVWRAIVGTDRQIAHAEIDSIRIPGSTDDTARATVTGGSPATHVVNEEIRGGQGTL